MNVLQQILSKRMAICLLSGFSSGLPLYIGSQLLPAWLRDRGVDLSTISLLGLAGLPYTWKFLWSPLVDRSPFPGLGRRKVWSLVSQITLFLLIASFAGLDPIRNPEAIGIVAFFLAFASATQDIALDAWRRELLPDLELGLGNALFVNAYRLSSLVPGSLALILADHLEWSTIHPIVALFMGIGIFVSLWAPEPARAPSVAGPRPPIWEPLSAWFRKQGGHRGPLILLFLLLYKLGDSVATSILTPFYLDLGFSMTEVGTVAKAASLWAVVLGGTLGGVLILKIGLYRSLWIFGIIQLLTILGFSALARIGPDPRALFGVVSAEYLGIGLGTAAFVGFIASSTDRRHTATQLALLSSITGIPRTVLGAGAGSLAEILGYPNFFVACALMALPGLALLPWVAPWGPDPRASEPEGTP
jgi:PAT family beta-lactamase induction signal transducer AmpG